MNNLTEILQQIIDNRIYTDSKLRTFKESVDIELPKFAGVYERREINISFSEFIINCKTCADSHSAYAYIITKLALNYSDSLLLRMTVSEAREIESTEWCNIVLARQIRVAENSGLGEQDKVFFAYRNGKISAAALKDSIEQTYYCIEQNFWYNIDDYIREYWKFAGTDVLFYSGDKNSKKNRLNETNDVFLNTFMKIKDGEQCFTLFKLEPGIYVVVTESKFRIVPFYFLENITRIQDTVYNKAIQYCDIIKPLEESRSPFRVKLKFNKEKI